MTFILLWNYQNEADEYLINCAHIVYCEYVFETPIENEPENMTFTYCKVYLSNGVVLNVQQAADTISKEIDDDRRLGHWQLAAQFREIL